MPPPKNPLSKIHHASCIAKITASNPNQSTVSQYPSKSSISLFHIIPADLSLLQSSIASIIGQAITAPSVRVPPLRVRALGTGMTKFSATGMVFWIATEAEIRLTRFGCAHPSSDIFRATAGVSFVDIGAHRGGRSCCSSWSR
jgi:hypothetical protein